jgi:hypothetical protein
VNNQMMPGSGFYPQDTNINPQDTRLWGWGGWGFRPWGWGFRPWGFGFPPFGFGFGMPFFPFFPFPFFI